MDSYEVGTWGEFALVEPGAAEKFGAANALRMAVRFAIEVAKQRGGDVEAVCEIVKAVAAGELRAERAARRRAAKK